MSPHLEHELDRRVEAFEAALALDPAADLIGHLPPPGDLHHLPVLAELIRIDLERGWRAGRPRRLADYAARFPVVAGDADVLRGVAFEEFRQRRLAGERVAASAYEAEYGIGTADWPPIEPGSAALHATCRTEILSGGGSLVATPAPSSGLPSVLNGFHLPSGGLGSVVAARPATPVLSTPASEPATGYTPFPAVGTDFLGFRLEDELGRGAFGRVYLARQADLSGRPVALKVAADIVDESRTLAQLQHPNIVPIYSYHRAGSFQAACMPYFGRTTLTQVVEGLSGRAAPPNSGRELKSTVNQGRLSTYRSSPPGDPAADPAHPPQVPAGGATAAADEWARLDGMSYVEAVLHLGQQLADGLGHAHERGILHRDLKPANVLLTDDGRPMLLDFNLAEDTKQRGTAERARMGGTLPYMAPEQLEAFRDNRGTLDGRCDVYALGVLLFELLTGRHPFPARRGPTGAVVIQMLTDRRVCVPSVRPFNRAASPAVDAIVRKCLAFDPAGRYRSAAELHEDLGRQLAHRPLRHAAEQSRVERCRKWGRRHPRLVAAAGVAAATLACALTFGAAAAHSRDQARDDHARVVLADHEVAFARAQLLHDDRNQSRPQMDRVIDTLRGTLARFGVPDDGRSDDWLAADPAGRLPAEDRTRLREDVGEAFYLMAQVACSQAGTAEEPGVRGEKVRQAGTWHAAAGRYAAGRLARAVGQQRADLASLTGDPAAGGLAAAVERTPPGSPRDLVLLGTRHARAGESLLAVRHLTDATRLDPTTLSGWFVRGTAHLDLGQPEAAAECFSACVSLRPGFAPAWLNRGLAYSEMRRWNPATDDLDRAIELDPALTEAYLLRAGVREARGDLDDAAADLGRALATGAAPSRAYFLRAAVRERLGDATGAAADRAAGLRARATDELSWIARAEARLAAGTSPARAAVAGGAFADVGVAVAALEDVEQALRLKPRSVPGLQLKAHILGERLRQPAAAMAVLDRAVELHPDHVPTRAGRAVELARAGDRAAALRDAREALLRDTKAPNLYQVGCVYALTSKTCPDDRREALRLIRSAFQAGFGLEIAEDDADLDPIRDDTDFRDLLRDARRLHNPHPR